MNQIHDSIKAQFPVAWRGPFSMATAILNLVISMERRLKTPEGREFIIPVEVEVGLNCNQFHKVDIRGGADRLAESIERTPAFQELSVR
jgi:hypothetical protein